MMKAAPRGLALLARGSSWILLIAITVATSFSFAACGSGDEGATAGDASAFADGVDPNAFELFWEPSEQTLAIDASGPKSATYVLKATSNGVTREVTPEAVSFDRPDLAKLGPQKTPVMLTADGQFAGTGTLKGAYLGKEAAAKLHVTVRAQEIGPGVDPAAIAALNASPLAQDPTFSTLLYPYDQTVWPLGLQAPLVMWNAPAASDVYRLHLEQSNYAYDGYFVVGSPGQQRITQMIWDRITTSNVGDPLRFELSRYDAAAKVAYASAKQGWPVAPGNLRGSIYYWTTSGEGHMASIRPGTGATPTVLNGGKCMGCHAVSADGTTLVAAVEDLSPSRAWQSFDLPSVTVATTGSKFGGNVAVSPEGKHVVYGSPTLELAEVKTGQIVATSGLETYAFAGDNDTLGMPAFSPNGKLLAFLEGRKTDGWHNLRGDAATLRLLDFDPATQKFSGLRSLADASQFPADARALAYPSFTPDSQWVAFHVGDKPTGCEDQCNDNGMHNGRIWMQNVNGSGLVRLDRLNDSSLNTDDHNRTYEPTFNPVERGGFFWVVVTSSRDWGNQLTGTPNNGKKRLWVAAIDKSPNGGDPSHPAFMLEGQEATTNMRGFWTLAKCTTSSIAGAAASPESACGAGFECCSGFCEQGVCVDVGQLKCVKTGGQCTKTEECCDSPSVQCIGGVCRKEGPK